MFVRLLSRFDCTSGRSPLCFRRTRPVVRCVSARRGVEAVAFTHGRSPKIQTGDCYARRERAYHAFCPLFCQNTPLSLSNQKGWANYPDGSRQLSHITKLALPSVRRPTGHCCEVPRLTDNAVIITEEARRRQPPSAGAGAGCCPKLPSPLWMEVVRRGAGCRRRVPPLSLSFSLRPWQCVAITN